jgi:hypothetical protein
MIATVGLAGRMNDVLPATSLVARGVGGAAAPRGADRDSSAKVRLPNHPRFTQSPRTRRRDLPATTPAGSWPLARHEGRGQGSACPPGCRVGIPTRLRRPHTARPICWQDGG